MPNRALDMSLDEVTKERSSANGNSNGRGRGARRSTGGGAAAARTPYERPSPRSTESAWTHDMYNARPGAAPRARSSGGSGNTEGSTRIMVMNVHYEVTEGDLKGIFMKVGKIVEGPKIRYDRSGRSTGEVSLEYETHQQARAAINSFDGQLAKGQPLSIRFDDARPRKSTAPDLLSRISGVNAPGKTDRRDEQRERGSGARGAPRDAPRGGAVRGAARGGATGRGRGGASGRPERRAPKTAEDLDKELEAFVAGPAPTETTIAQPQGLGADDVEMS